MRKLLLGVAGAAALAASSALAQETPAAPAAPEPPASPEPSEPREATPPKPWTGPYVGLLAGFSISNPYGYYQGYFVPGPAPTPTPTPTPSPTPTPTPGVTPGVPAYIAYNISPHFTDFNFGLAGGYNLQQGKIVIGVDTDLGWYVGSGGGQVFDPAGSGRWDRVKLIWGGHLRSRLGYDLNGWLPYVAGGFVFNQVEAQHFGVAPGAVQPSTWSKQNMRYGYSLGIGVEKQFYDNTWSFRGEWLRDYLNRQTYHWVDDLLLTSTTIEVDVVRVGLIKRF